MPTRLYTYIVKPEQSKPLREAPPYTYGMPRRLQAMRMTLRRWRARRRSRRCARVSRGWRGAPSDGVAGSTAAADGVGVGVPAGDAASARIALGTSRRVR